MRCVLLIAALLAGGCRPDGPAAEPAGIAPDRPIGKPAPGPAEAPLAAPSPAPAPPSAQATAPEVAVATQPPARLVFEVEPLGRFEVITWPEAARQAEARITDENAAAEMQRLRQAVFGRRR